MIMMQRRDFLTAAGRYTLFGVLGVVAAATLKNAQKAPATSCPARISCSDCNLLRNCSLDKAEEARNTGSIDIN